MENLSFCRDNERKNLMNWIREMGEKLYPDVGLKTRRVPPVKFNVQKLREEKTKRRVDCKVLELPTDTDKESNRVENIVSGAFECLSNNMVLKGTGTAMFLISNFEYDNYLNKIDLSQLTSDSSLGQEEAVENTESYPKFSNSTDQRPARHHVVRLPKDVAKRGELDILILQQEAGILLVQTKAVGYNLDETKSLDLDYCKEYIQTAIDRAGKQLSRDHQVMFHVMQDLGLRHTQMTSVIALPNLPRHILQQALELCDSLKHMVYKDFALNPDLNFMCAEDFYVDDCGCQTALETWWKQKLLAQSEILELEIMKQIAYRTVGLVSTVSVWSFTQPRIEVRNLNDATWETGNRYTQVILSDQQAQLLKREEKYFYLWGPAGSGKTLLLSLKGRQWLRNNRDVVILNTRLGSKGRKVGHVMENTINKTKGLNKKAIRIDLDLVASESSFQADILKQVKKGSSPFFLLDEATWVEETNKLMSVLKSCFPDSTIWCAGMLQECQPLGFESDTLKDILRCPPWVQRILRVVDNREDRSHLYTLNSVNAGLSTDGPRPYIIIHSEHGPPSVHPYDCAKCAKQLSDFLLNELNLKKETGPSSNDQKPAKESFGMIHEDSKHQQIDGSKCISEELGVTHSKQAGTKQISKVETSDQLKEKNQSKKGSKKSNSKDASYQKYFQKDGDTRPVNQCPDRISVKAFSDKKKGAPSLSATTARHTEATPLAQGSECLTAGSDSGCGSACETDIWDGDFDQDSNKGLDTGGPFTCSSSSQSENTIDHNNHPSEQDFHSITVARDLAQKNARTDSRRIVARKEAFQSVQDCHCKKTCDVYKAETIPFPSAMNLKGQIHFVDKVGEKLGRQNSKARKKQRESSRQSKDTISNTSATTRGNKSHNGFGSRLHFSDAVLPVTMPKTWHHFTERGYWAISQQALAQNMVLMGSADFIKQLHESGIPVKVEVGMVQLNKEKETGNRLSMCPLGSVHGLEYKVVICIPSPCALPEYKDINLGIIDGKMGPQVKMRRTKFAEELNQEEQRLLTKKQRAESCSTDQTRPYEFQEETDTEESDKVRISTHVEGPPSDILYETRNPNDPVLTIINGQLCFQTSESSSATVIYPSSSENGFDNLSHDSEGASLKQRRNNSHLKHFNNILSRDTNGNQGRQTHCMKRVKNNRARIGEQDVNQSRKIDIPGKQASPETSALLSTSLSSPSPSPSSCSPPLNLLSPSTSPSLSQPCLQSVAATEASQYDQMTQSVHSLRCPQQDQCPDKSLKMCSFPSSPSPYTTIDAALQKLKQEICGHCGTNKCVCEYFKPSELEALHRLDQWNKAYVLMCASRCTSQLILVLP